MDLKGKNALVTGSGIRLGRAIALALGEAGCNLALHYNTSVESVIQVKSDLEKMGRKAHVFQQDLEDISHVQDLMTQVCSEFGHIDILINNAGIYPAGSGKAATPEKINKVFNVNLFSPWLLISAFASQLPREVQGKVINISDGKVFRNGTDHFSYRVTKQAINTITAMFALELAPNITVNAIAPGTMLPLLGYEHVDLQVVADRQIPLKRIGSPEIIAQNVLHILSQDFMTGDVIRVDGGEFL
ncbi:MAG TPA: SDR family oxidoreductase [Anaerolineaceae bacterium]|nr:SDR family oxidoreductase [Anaerolineaceae bacterium]HQJ32099.1 SDR family oxidoreductase [Anaerolineaceae bacterium]